MKLSKLTNSEKRDLCRWYFRAGFFFLPFVWLVNAIWFFRDAFQQPNYPEQKEIRKYVIISAIGGTFWLSLLVTWIATFQTYRAEWGENADLISFIIPTGSA